MGKLIGALLTLAIFAALIAAYVEHIIVCIHQHAWVLLGFGCIFGPVGIVHGIGCWFGAF